MIAKGNNMFQIKVKDEAQAIENLLLSGPNQLEKDRQKVEDEADKDSDVFDVWDDETQSNVPYVCRPSTDTEFIDNMLDEFYTAMVVKIYSFAENGLQLLLGTHDKLKNPKGKSGQRQPSNLDLYYQAIGEKYEVDLPKIENLWPNKNGFHSLRIHVTHKGKSYLTKEEIEHLSIDVDDVLKMLLFVEEKIREKHPEINP